MPGHSFSHVDLFELTIFSVLVWSCYQNQLGILLLAKVNLYGWPQQIRTRSQLLPFSDCVLDAFLTPLSSHLLRHQRRHEPGEDEGVARAPHEGDGDDTPAGDQVGGTPPEPPEADKDDKPEGGDQGGGTPPHDGDSDDEPEEDEGVARAPQGSDTDEESVSMPDCLPPDDKIWKGGRPGKFFGCSVDETNHGKNPAKSRYKPYATGYRFKEFAIIWRDTNGEEPDIPLFTEAHRVERNEFVDQSFQRWGWATTEEHKALLEKMRLDMSKEMQRARTTSVRDRIQIDFSHRIAFSKKERRQYRRSFELEWMFGTAAMVSGLKYNPMTSTFTARIEYDVVTYHGSRERKVDSIPVSEEWIKDAEYADGVIQHVINLGLTSDFVEVPPGRHFRIQAKKVHGRPKARHIIYNMEVWVTKRHNDHSRAEEHGYEKLNGQLKEFPCPREVPICQILMMIPNHQQWRRIPNHQQ